MARRRIGPTRLATGRRTPDVPCNTPSVPLARKRAYTLSLSGTSSCVPKVARMNATCCDAFVVHREIFDPPALDRETTAARMEGAERSLERNNRGPSGRPMGSRYETGGRTATGASLHFSQRLQAL